MSYLIDAIIMVREMQLLCFVVIISPMGVIDGALLLGST
jgi:hypothetical protein